jgi:hypothetical protein
MKMLCQIIIQRLCIIIMTLQCQIIMLRLCRIIMISMIQMVKCLDTNGSISNCQGLSVNKKAVKEKIAALIGTEVTVTCRKNGCLTWTVVESHSPPVDELRSKAI